jgi:hypothetical protein
VPQARGGDLPKTKQEITDSMSELDKVLEEARTHGFWGHIELDYNDGQLVVIRKTETTKLKTRMGANRDEHTGRTTRKQTS